MGFADFYFNRQKDFKIKIHDKPEDNLRFIVVIPCFNEDNLIETLESIRGCEKIASTIEVIVIINSAENADQKILDQNQKTYKETKCWIDKNSESSLRFFVLHEKDLPQKFAGAGLARKIGMDQAVSRFNQLNRQDGVIVSIDADSKLKPNYFIELEKHFLKHPRTNTVTTYFEHPVKGNEYSSDIYSAITIYELYLRYYKQALTYTGFPYSYYTIGSCFAVSTTAYVKQGGMNRKQAGEDFYFLHKVFPLGNCFEINTTCVYPSPRPSDRVPFGTGPMVQSIMNSGDDEFLTYNFEAFEQLKSFFDCVDDFFRIEKQALELTLKRLPACIVEFLYENDIEIALKEINENSSNPKTFVKRFFNWFDAFKVLKFLNFAHENHFEKQDLLRGAEVLLKKIPGERPVKNDFRTYLECYRQLERKF